MLNWAFSPMNMAKVDHGLQLKMCTNKALKIVPIGHLSGKGVGTQARTQGCLKVTPEG